MSPRQIGIFVSVSEAKYDCVNARYQASYMGDSETEASYYTGGVHLPLGVSLWGYLLGRVFHKILFRKHA